MKRITAILFLLVLALPVFGQTQILYKDDFTIQYDTPATLPEVLPGETLVYRIWLWDMAQGAPPITTTVGWTFIGETMDLEQYVVTPIVRHEYAVGVQLVHIRADLVETLGDFAVSTNVADVDPMGIPGVPFTYAPAGLPVLGKVQNLRDSGI